MRFGSRRVIRRSLWLGGLVLVTATALTPNAVAVAFRWSRPIALDRTGGEQDLQAVSCPSISQCTIVNTALLSVGVPVHRF